MIGILKGLWQFISYLFWPQWGRTRGMMDDVWYLNRITAAVRKGCGCLSLSPVDGITNLRRYGVTEIKRRYDKWWFERDAEAVFLAKWSRSCRKRTQRRKIGFFRNPQSPLPKGAPPHPVVPHPQGRDKLKIAGTDDLQSFGIARKLSILTYCTWNGKVIPLRRF